MSAALASPLHPSSSSASPSPPDLPSRPPSSRYQQHHYSQMTTVPSAVTSPVNATITSTTRETSLSFGTYVPSIAPSPAAISTRSHANSVGATDNDYTHYYPHTHHTHTSPDDHTHHHHRHSNHPSHRSPRSQLSIADQQLARALQQEEESRASEDAIRRGLTLQFAKVAGRAVEEVDLSQLTLAEAAQAIEIQAKITAQKKKGLLGGLRARFRKKSSNTGNSPQHLIVSPSSSSSHQLTISSSNGHSPSPGNIPPSPGLSPYVDIDNMSYEELLALSEQIGQVKSKGLTEAEIERLPTSIYQVNQRTNQNNTNTEECKTPSSPAAQAQSQSPTVSDPSPSPSPTELKKKRSLFARLLSKKDHSEPEEAEEEQKKQGDVSLSLSVSPLSSPVSSSAVVVPSNADSLRSASLVCSICLEAFVAGDLLKYLPCFHSFHSAELDQWLSVNASCPLCKQVVVMH